MSSIIHKYNCLIPRSGAAEELQSAGENARLFKALAHPTRLRIVALIREQRPCVKGMEELLGISQPNLSQHLSLLRHTGVVESEREGNQVCYRIKNEMVLKLLDALSQ